MANPFELKKNAGIQHFLHFPTMFLTISLTLCRILSSVLVSAMNKHVCHTNPRKKALKNCGKKRSACYQHLISFCNVFKKLHKNIIRFWKEMLYHHGNQHFLLSHDIFEIHLLNSFITDDDKRSFCGQCRSRSDCTE